MKNKSSSARRLLPANMFGHWPHVCCVRITFGLIVTNCFVSTTTNLNSMECLVNWIPLRICVRSKLKITQPFLQYETYLFCFVEPHHIDSTVAKTSELQAKSATSQ